MQSLLENLKKNLVLILSAAFGVGVFITLGYLNIDAIKAKEEMSVANSKQDSAIFKQDSTIEVIEKTLDQYSNEKEALEKVNAELIANAEIARTEYQKLQGKAQLTQEEKERLNQLTQQVSNFEQLIKKMKEDSIKAQAASKDSVEKIKASWVADHKRLQEEIDKYNLRESLRAFKCSSELWLMKNFSSLAKNRRSVRAFVIGACDGRELEGEKLPFDERVKLILYQDGKESTTFADASLKAIGDWEIRIDDKFEKAHEFVAKDNIRIEVHVKMKGLETYKLWCDTGVLSVKDLLAKDKWN